MIDRKLFQNRPSNSPVPMIYAAGVFRPQKKAERHKNFLKELSVQHLVRSSLLACTGVLSW